MRILIIGGNGMLGHELLNSFMKNHDAKVTLKNGLDQYAMYNMFTQDNSYDRIDVRSMESVKAILEKFMPEAVINAAGIIKQRNESKDYISSIDVNSLFPHKLAVACGEIDARLIHMSTDCVFSGDKGNYKEDDFSDGDDIYARTKYLGEIKNQHCVTLRTSILGLELRYKESLVEWFLAQRGQISGYCKAIYTGLTTMEMARVIEMILLKFPDLSGLYQVASKPVSKFELLSELARLLKRNDIEIKPDNDFHCDRSLNAERFKLATGYTAPPWNIMLKEIVERIESREHTPI